MNQLLGYPTDARLLIITADDFGFCQSVNDAITQTLEQGMVQSTTLMMLPCAAAQNGVNWLQQHPQVSFGVHLTLICDTMDRRFGPLTDRQLVPSLLDQDGCFYDFDGMARLRAKARLAEVEIEFRAQIEAVLAVNLHPTHLDWHALRFGERLDIVDLMIGLAKEYGLALRVIGESTIGKVKGMGLPCIDFDFLDSCSLEIETKLAHITRLLQELPVGLSEWAVHPGLGDGDLKLAQPSMIPIWQSDFEAMMSPLLKNVIDKEGIVLLDYGALQPFWRNAYCFTDSTHSISCG